MTAVMISTMVVCFALTVSVAVSIGLASVLGIQASNAHMLISVKEMFGAINKFPLAAIPFFILAGNLMETGGISRRLVEFAKSIVGGVQGGLPMTCVLTCMIFAAVSGSSVATTFAIGAILIPALIKHGYPTSYAAALQATSAELGVIIPPSIPTDPVWRERRGVDRRAVHRGLRPGPADQRRADAVRLALLQMEGLGQERRHGPHAAWPRHAAGRLGAADAGDHPGRHLRRHLHAHRGLGRGGVLRAGGGRRDLPRDQAPGPVRDPAQVGALVGRDHVHHRQRRPVRLPDHARRRARRHWPLAAGGAAVARAVPARA